MDYSLMVYLQDVAYGQATSISLAAILVKPIVVILFAYPFKQLQDQVDFL